MNRLCAGYCVNCLLILVMTFTFVSAYSAELPVDLTQKIDDYLESVWGEGQVIWKVNSRNFLAHIPENSELEVVPCGQHRGSTLLNINILKDGKLQKRLPINIKIFPFAWVPVADIDIKQNDILVPEMFRWERREVTQLRGSWPQNDSELGENIWWTKRLVRQNEILTFDRIEPRPEIVRGDMIELVSIRGGVTITADGIALQNGKSGERIKVENLSNGVCLRGKVQSAGRVQVEGVDRKRGLRK